MGWPVWRADWRTGMNPAGLVRSWRRAELSHEVTARGFHFFTLNRDLLRVHEELQYEVTRARADRVRFSLPLDTPQGVSIQETGDVGIGEYIFEETATERLWTVTLTRPVLGRDSDCARF